MSEPPEPSRLPSSVEGRLRQLRGELVLQLFMRSGPLWEAVRDVRHRWNITAKVQIPPSVLGRLLPEDAPERDFRTTHTSRKYTEYAMRWQDEMTAIRHEVVPQPHAPTDEHFDYLLNMSWNDFLAACVLYDPPEDRLIEFASYASVELGKLPDEQYLGKSGLKDLPEMVNPPIKTLWALMELRDWYWQRVLDYIYEQYLEPQGVDVQSLLEWPTQHIPGLLEEHSAKYREYSKYFYIEVDQYTSWEDVKNAFGMIRSKQPAKRTKPPRDRLSAVQCAILYDHHNEPDPEDKRRRRWTYAKLADHLGLSSYRVVPDYLSLGREILQGEEPDEKIG